MDMLRFDDFVNLMLVTFCGLVAAIVFAVIIRSFIVCRPATGDDGRRGDRRALVEIAWAIVPMVILVATAAPAVKGLVTSAVATASHSPPTLTRTGERPTHPAATQHRH